MSPRDIPNTNVITMFMHCALCAEEWKAHKFPGKSMRDIVHVEIGYTKQGIQVWCVRHEKNIMHVDFEGQQHHANMTRHLEPGT